MRQRPMHWKINVENYIAATPKNSFYLYDTLSISRGEYMLAFVDKTTLREIEYLIKVCLAKHHYGDKKPRLDTIRKISNKALPERKVDTESDD